MNSPVNTPSAAFVPEIFAWTSVGPDGLVIIWSSGIPYIFWKNVIVSDKHTALEGGSKEYLISLCPDGSLGSGFQYFAKLQYSLLRVPEPRPFNSARVNNCVVAAGMTTQAARWRDLSLFFNHRYTNISDNLANAHAKLNRRISRSQSADK